jgi:hypothetical protein
MFNTAVKGGLMSFVRDFGASLKKDFSSCFRRDVTGFKRAFLVVPGLLTIGGLAMEAICDYRLWRATSFSSSIDFEQLLLHFKEWGSRSDCQITDVVHLVFHLMLFCTLVPTLFNEWWWFRMGQKMQTARTKEARQIAHDVQQGTHGSMASNTLAFFFVPFLLHMKSYEAAIFLMGYGIFRKVASIEEDGVRFKLRLLTWVGNVAGGGAGINLGSTALQMSFWRAVIAFCMKPLASWCIRKANQLGEQIEQPILVTGAAVAATNGKPEGGTARVAQTQVEEPSQPQT